VQREPIVGKKAFVVVGSLVGTGLLVALVFSLGSWGFKHRQASLHVGRLQRLIEQQATAEQVQAGLEAEGGRLVASGSGESQIQLLARQWAPSAEAVVSAKGKQFPHARVFKVGEVVYVLFLDGDGRVKDFVYVVPDW